MPSLFVGDTLFAGSIGRTDLPGGDYPTLMRAITEVLFAFPDDSPVFSGHGPETTIGRERATNPFVLEYLSLGKSQDLNVQNREKFRATVSSSRRTPRARFSACRRR